MHDSLLEKALRMAACAHRNQTRKGSDTPYIYHPFAVGLLLQKYGYPTEWIIAGLLHDTVEDTGMSLEELRREFGAEIAGLVESCSEPDHHTLPWHERKAHTVAFLRTAPHPVKVITCADKLHNLSSILYDIHLIGDSIWQRFNTGREQQEWYYRAIDSSLRDNLELTARRDIFDAYSRTVEEIFGKTE